MCRDRSPVDGECNGSIRPFNKLDDEKRNTVAGSHLSYARSTAAIAYLLPSNTMHIA
jgi:hypothetical protein